MNATDDIYENIDDYNPSRQRKILIGFGDMVADIMTKKVPSYNQRIIYYMQKTKKSTCVYHSVLFFCPKDVTLNSAHYLIMRFNYKRELQNIVINDSADIDFKDFVKIYRKYTKESYSFLDNRYYFTSK